MEKYLIYFNDTPTSKRYVSTIYRNSSNDTTDIGDAIEFDNKDVALNVAEYLNKRTGTTKYKVLCIKTTMEEVVE